jgi:hypothetical protein
MAASPILLFLLLLKKCVGAHIGNQTSGNEGTLGLENNIQRNLEKKWLAKAFEISLYDIFV